MSYEDSFDREANDERCYIHFEREYIYKHMTPESIGPWEWRLMFDKVPFHTTFGQAAKDAKEMARELECSVSVNFSSYYRAQPDNHYMTPEDRIKLGYGGLGTTYDMKRGRFIDSLILEGRYPDIVNIASETKNQDSGAIWRGYLNGIQSDHELVLRLAKELDTNDLDVISRRRRAIYMGTDDPLHVE